MNSTSSDVSLPPTPAARPGKPAPIPRRVAEVLGPVLRNTDGTGWSVRKLADGGQARLFTVEAREAETPPAADGLIVKVYYGDGVAEREAVRDEYECLRRLHARLDGTTQHGWRVCCPRPVHLCTRSAALVMTRVPGIPLSRHLASREGPPSEVLESVARAAVSCLRRYWEGEARLYGDLILNNILCDLPSRTLSLVDPGMPEPFYDCAAAPRAWYPASRDLGFLLFWTASLVRASIPHPVLHARQKRMTGRILRTFLEGFESAAERTDATNEIEACARLHLARMATPLSPQGIWRRLVKRATTRTVTRILRDLREADRMAVSRGRLA